MTYEVLTFYEYENWMVVHSGDDLTAAKEDFNFRVGLIGKDRVKLVVILEGKLNA